MSPKRLRFIAEYGKDFNATQAAIRAGYSAKCARTMGGKLVSNGAIKAEIEKRNKEIADDCEVTVEWIVKQLKELHQTAKVESVKLGTLEFLGKWQGMMKDKGDAPQIVFVGADDFDKDPAAGMSGG